MNNLIERIKETLNVCIPWVLIVLAALDLTGAVKILDQWWPIIIGGLSTVQAVLHIWLVALRARSAKVTDASEQGTSTV